MSQDGHGELCYYCHEPCDGLAANPAKWPIPLCHSSEPGKVEWHHVGCVAKRLQRLEAIEGTVKKNEHNPSLNCRALTQHETLEVSYLVCEAWDLLATPSPAAWAHVLAAMKILAKAGCGGAETRLAEYNAKNPKRE